MGKRVVILYDADTVETYCGLNLVATHDRCDIPYTYSWKKEHNLPGHYSPYDKDLEELFRRAAEMDNIVLDYLREVDRRMQYPPKSFSSCRGILSLEKKYGTDRLMADAYAPRRNPNTDIRHCVRSLNRAMTPTSFPTRTGQSIPRCHHPPRLCTKTSGGANTTASITKKT